MISRDDYKTHLLSKGSHLGEVRKNQADMIMNTTFTEDIAYRRVYILDPVSGWHYEDAKLFKHQTPQLARDAVDSWLRFRPKVHYPVGCYVFIPDDTSYKLDIDEERPFKGNIGNLHMIVDRTYYKQFPQYMVLKINWDLKWVMGSGDRKRIDHCLGCVRNANSYTSCDAMRGTARCIGKPCSVFLLIAGNPLEPYWLQRSNEIYTSANC